MSEKKTLKKAPECGKTPILMDLQNQCYKMTIVPKAVYRVNTIPTKIPTIFFREIDETILKFIWNYNSPQMEKEQC